LVLKLPNGIIPSVAKPS